MKIRVFMNFQYEILFLHYCVSSDFSCFLNSAVRCFLISTHEPSSKLEFLILSQNSWRLTKSGPLIRFIREKPTNQSFPLPAPCTLLKNLSVFILTRL